MIAFFIIIGHIIGLLLTAYFWGKLSDDMLEKMQLENHEDGLMFFVIFWPLAWLYVLEHAIELLFTTCILFILNKSKRK